ncbi:hypothetical protein KSP35_15680 [Aquihabitans sp. G128]|uniref:hypothetical protein n=1 Tax=Aquihabitans sp. G128 TaxID=2849779 RepID=UPI001C251302|nr:hypothetical protein [Aquihabitans sp. G128]QXC59811.1 hypothetical protein KSP35_15680 [Aquihabitans sp. G128]
MGGAGGTWTVDVTADGTPVTVRGELLLYPSPSPLPWLAIVAVAAAVVLGVAVAAVRRGAAPPHRAIAFGLAGLGGLATVVGTVQWRSIPPGAGGNPVTAVVPAIAVVAALAAALVDRYVVRLAGLAAAAAALTGWAVLRRQVLFRAVLPTDLSFPVDRVGTALALGAGVATAAVLAWRPPTKRPASARAGRAA